MSNSSLGKLVPGKYVLSDSRDWKEYFIINEDGKTFSYYSFTSETDSCTPGYWNDTTTEGEGSIVQKNPNEVLFQFTKYKFTDEPEGTRNCSCTGKEAETQNVVFATDGNGIVDWKSKKRA